MIKKFYFQLFVVASLMAALSMVPASVKAGDESPQGAKSGSFIKPSSGLDIKPDIDERKKASNRLPLSDTIDIGPVFGKAQKQDVLNKKHPIDHRALLGITFRY